jgi:hypothetical protein
MTAAANLPSTSRTAPASASATPRRPPLMLVQPPAVPAGRAPFVAAVVVLLAAGLLGLLVLNTVLAKDAFRLHTLQVETKALAEREQVLTREVESLRAPGALAARAAALGMVPAGPPAFLRLPDGAVLGAPAGPAEGLEQAAPAAPPPPASPAPARAEDG